MSNHQFLPGRRFRWDNTDYCVKGVQDNGKTVLLEIMLTEERKTYSVFELVTALSKGQLWFEIKGHLAFPRFSRHRENRIY